MLIIGIGYIVVFVVTKILMRKMYNIKNETLNDIEMLSQNGIGIAMKNALPEVKKVCVGVTSSNDENGIVKWLDGNNV